MSHPEHLVTVLVLGGFAVFLVAAIWGYFSGWRWAKVVMIGIGCLMVLPFLLPFARLFLGVRPGRTVHTTTGNISTAPAVHIRSRAIRGR